MSVSTLRKTINEVTADKHLTDVELWGPINGAIRRQLSGGERRLMEELIRDVRSGAITGDSDAIAQLLASKPSQWRVAAERAKYPIIAGGVPGYLLGLALPGELGQKLLAPLSFGSMALFAPVTLPIAAGVGAVTLFQD